MVAYLSVGTVRSLTERLAAVTVLAGAIFVANPTTVALQDVTGLLRGTDEGRAEWTAYLVPAAAGSLHQVEANFDLDPTVTGSIASAGFETAEGKVVVTPEKALTPETPDEERINRAEKTGRIVSVTPVAPPKDFSAGSVLERHSSLLREAEDEPVRMAFKAPEIAGKEIQIATAFYKREEKKADPQVPVMLASLVTNEKADSLATAYAPVEPDFAVESPFTSLIKEPDENAGRFIPPVPESDFSWARNPLPAAAFSKREQKCLAEGIYFEARGENLEGQAAVAQVILNRVRNPTFPNSICGVVYQNVKWRNRCQFSFACDGKKERITQPRHWQIAQDVALATTAGKIWLDDVGSSTHYHATYVRPRWARRMERRARIGLHIFYRTFNGGWS